MPKAPWFLLLLLSLIAVTACASGSGDGADGSDQSQPTVVATDPDDDAPVQQREQAAATAVEVAAADAARMEGTPPPAPVYNTPPRSESTPDEDQLNDEGAGAASADAETALANLNDFLTLTYPDHEGFAVLPLDAPPGETSLVAIHSTGFAPFPAGHVFGIYEIASDAVTDLGTLELESFPSFILDDGVVLVRAANGKPAWGSDRWFAVDGGTGAHGSTFDLLRFNDSDGLRSELFWSTGIPFGAGTVVDLNEDGIPEVVLDLTDAYIFCYACGVRLFDSQILRWDPETDALVELTLEPLPADADADLREAVDTAIALAQADLWQDARTAIGVACVLAPEDPTVFWNAAQISWIADLRVEPVGPYPLLELVFAGNHTAAVDYLATFDPFDLIDLYGPLTAGTAAEGWESVVAETLVDYADRALTVRPDLAPALFLRGLGRFWLDPAQADLAITDVNAAAALDPDQPLYEAFANLLTP